MPMLPLTDDELATVTGAGPEEIVAQVIYLVTGGHRSAKAAQ